jgi:hypothetical protein
MNVTRSYVLLALTTLPASGGTVAPDPQPHPSPAADQNDASPTGPADAGGASTLGHPNPTGTVVCPWDTAQDQEVQPPATYDKSCRSITDCAIGLHLHNCCGQEIAIGTNVADLGLFQRPGGICGNEHAECKCLAGGTITEDGNVVLRPGGIAVDCVRGLCTTNVAP